MGLNKPWLPSEVLSAVNLMFECKVRGKIWFKMAAFEKLVKSWTISEEMVSAVVDFTGRDLPGQDPAEPDEDCLGFVSVLTSRFDSLCSIRINKNLTHTGHPWARRQSRTTQKKPKPKSLDQGRMNPDELSRQ